LKVPLWSLLLAAALALFLLPSVKAGRWVLAYDTPEEMICSLAEYNGKLFAGTGQNGRIYVYDGRGWSVAFQCQEDWYVWAMCVYKNKLYASGEPYGTIYIYDGENWSEGDSFGYSVYSLAVYGDKLWWATEQGIWSYDGENWTLSLDSSKNMRSLAVYNNRLYAGTTDAGVVYRFDGSYWQLVHDYIVPNSIPALTVYGNSLVVGTGEDGRIYLSDGESQTSLSYDPLEQYVWCFASYADNLFAGTGGPKGAIYTFDGSVWSRSLENVGSDVYSLAVYENRLYAGTAPDGQIYCLSEFEFSADVSPDNLKLAANPSASSTVTVNLLSTVAQEVHLSGEWVGTAPDVSVSLSENHGTPPFTATLTFTKGPAAESGTFRYRLTVYGGGLVRTKEILLNVVVPPAAPTPILPESGSCLETTTPTFDWSDVPGATSYQLELATDNAFARVVLTKSSAESSVALSTAEALSYGTLYYWRVRGVNEAGPGRWSPVWSFTAKMNPPKVLNLRMAGGAAFTASPEVQLSLEALNATEFSLSADGVIWGEWQPYTSSVPYTLEGPDGMKRVYVRVRDNEGYISPTASASIVLDRTPPLSQHSLTGELTAQGYKSSVVVTLTSTDLLAGVSRIEYWVDGVKKEASGSSVSFPITDPGKHTVEYRATDGAGNVENTRRFEVTVYVPGLGVPTAVWAVLGALGAAAVAAVGVVRATRTSRRLRAIKAEKEQLLRMRKEAELKFYKEATMSREAFDSFMKDYHRRMAELEREEGMLRKKVKREG
jgi:hypothetical protein